jgi:mono/diheme cytochrome c family protein
MRAVIRAFVRFLVVALVAGAALTLYVVRQGVGARGEPGAIETFLARNLRKLAIERHAGERRNPVPLTEESLAVGRAHFADHCAVCHANDGSGETEMGRGLWPKAPDMRQAGTQSLSDGELFYIIENGVRMTGMPAWGTGTPEGEEASWQLVHFIRHLPAIAPEEIEAMERMNPKSAEQWREETEIEAFLAGGDVPPPPAPPQHKH